MPQATWQGGHTRLDLVLPALGFARSRSQASEFITSGKVRINSVVVTKTGAKVGTGSVIEVEELDHYVSRAAHKLLEGLDQFGVDPTGRLVLDAGASTGGFTQVLLERGVREVLAIDVGHGQLDETLRRDERVRVVEGCNVRELTPESLEVLTGVDEPPSIVVADLSFISLSLVLPALSQVASQDAVFLVLIKPQYEVGRTGISDGIVVNAQLAAQAVLKVIHSATKIGLMCAGLVESPITGERGNREVLCFFHRVRDNDNVPPEWEEQLRQIFHTGGQA